MGASNCKSAGKTGPATGRGPRDSDTEHRAQQPRRHLANFHVTSETPPPTTFGFCRAPPDDGGHGTRTRPPSELRLVARKGHSEEDWEFNDRAFYLRLRSEAGCARVDLSCVKFRHSKLCLRLQSAYRSTFCDGSTRFTLAPAHFFYHAHDHFYNAGWNQEKAAALDLAADEYLIGLRLKEGSRLDRLAFVTNHRTFVVGRQTCDPTQQIKWDVNLTPPDNLCRIVAFAGASNRGLSEKIGFYTVRDSWVSLRGLIMLRWLFEQQRASFHPGRCAADQLALRMLVATTSDDVWRLVLSFAA